MCMIFKVGMLEDANLKNELGWLVLWKNEKITWKHF